MTASWRGIAALAVVAVLLLVAALVGGRAEAVDRAVLPGVDAATIDKLVWSRPGQSDVVATRGSDGWLVDGAPADHDAIDATLTALRAGRWQRRADVVEAGAVDAELHAGAAALGIAQPLPGTDQQWLVVHDRALLVDGWVAHALDPPPLELHQRRPLADVGPGWTVELDGGLGRVTLDLATREAAVHDRKLRLAAAVVDRLVRASEAVELVTLAPPPHPPDPVLVITARRKHVTRDVTLIGPCGADTRRDAIASATDAGCIDHGVAVELLAAYGTVASAAETSALTDIIDRRPAADALTVQLDSGPTIDLRHTQIAGQPADPEAVGALFAALVSPCDVVPVATAPVRATLTVTDKAGNVTRLEVRGDVVIRDGEPVGLKPSPDRLAALTAPAQLLRDRQLWLEEPTAIATITVDGQTVHRGAVVGEWDTAPARFSAIDLLAAAVAAPRALPTLDVPPQDAVMQAHQVAFTTAPPAGTPVHHEVAVALGRDGRCIARTDTTRYVERSLCDAVAAATAKP